ncbi:uncharacterized protein SPSK_05622 [Sporothrix schenckii 1099-18]|uniref:Uncharacterized protein n=1 Tax=Sporothrix schenckii 1099-18 TaxID=1397361 RepID=A0A0F2LW24_SPOSC|nr:uncharacterized protein SPSK_05622 [Sporothrix schenckii 1099-18]KJR80700.1 hypothetical protein SPSK_05622 [Sporothrix schenckii 1099-18]
MTHLIPFPAVHGGPGDRAIEALQDSTRAGCCIQSANGRHRSCHRSNHVTSMTGGTRRHTQVLRTKHRVAIAKRTPATISAPKSISREKRRYRGRVRERKVPGDVDWGNTSRPNEGESLSTEDDDVLVERSSPLHAPGESEVAEHHRTQSLRTRLLMVRRD